MILNTKEFDVLGLKVKLRSDQLAETVSPEEVVEFVRGEAAKILKASPQLTKGDVGILLALKFAQEKLDLEKELKNGLEGLQNSAKDALRYIEEVSTQVQ